jgi:hypothetical protein
MTASLSSAEIHLSHTAETPRTIPIHKLMSFFASLKKRMMELMEKLVHQQKNLKKNLMQTSQQTTTFLPLK